jgi:general secretion pathway protein I
MRHRASEGFTLIEVMIALFIFAISATALSTVFQNNVTTAVALKQRTLGMWVAQNKLAEIRAMDMFPDINTRDDKIPFAGSDWVMRTTVTATQLPGLRRIEFKVAPAAGFDGNSFMTSLSAYVSDTRLPE